MRPILLLAFGFFLMGSWGCETAGKRFDADPFLHGVASGDPLSDAVIIWTRISGATDTVVGVEWVVARDSNLTRVVQKGRVLTSGERDFTVKVDVQHLVADTYYYYRFKVGGFASAIGRTKTAPAADAVTEIRLAVASCSNYEAGYFNAYGYMAEQADLDAVLHLGDYIYEYEPGHYGDSTLTRKHLPGAEIVSLADYRTRYGQYRMDRALQEVHRLHPFITIWDDHEITNNAYTEGAQNHQVETEGDFLVRKAAARKAYYEWLPVREGGALYRNFRWGLAELWMLDERLAGRSAPVANESDSTYGDSLRAMLGKKQFEWLASGLRGSTARWKIIGNQVIFADLSHAGFWEVLGEKNSFAKNMDAWDGYPFEKKRLLDVVGGVKNVVFVTGDSHCSWGFEVNGGDGRPLAVEFGTPGITSANYDEYFGLDTVKIIESAYLEYNAHLKYVDLHQQGYFVLTLSASEARADFFYVDNLKTAVALERVGRSISVAKDSSRLRMR